MTASDQDLATILARLLALELSHEDRLSYTPQTAAEATGLSKDMIYRAIHAGDLAVSHPIVNRRRITSNVILREELVRWLTD